MTYCKMMALTLGKTPRRRIAGPNGIGISILIFIEGLLVYNSTNNVESFLFPLKPHKHLFKFDFLLIDILSGMD